VLALIQGSGWEFLCFLLHTFRAGGSRSETEFIGFVGRRARTKPESGLLFRLFPFQGSRSKTEFIGFAGWRARTESERGTGVGVA
ncbi:MAG: hypothetical protein UDJ85_07130, partial [Clostridia bacterium]|nr:hypothetical protein [Clostridia bacterium]